MASKRHQRRKACTGKIKYKSRQKAAEVINILWKKDMEKMHPYRCPFCKCWHVGHNNN